jgi:molecular chaperone GrpE
MRDKKFNRNTDDQPVDPHETPDGVQEAFETPLGSTEEWDKLKNQLEEAQARSAEYMDGWQRSRAEFDNYRKRIERENQLVYQNAVGNIIKRYLPILDDLERAMQSRPADMAWVAGIDLIYRKLQSILDCEGVKRIEAEGQLFDPNFHEAISQEHSDLVPSGHVVAVVQNGYMLGEKVIRPAMVRISE